MIHVLQPWDDFDAEPTSGDFRNRTHGLRSTYKAGCRCKPCTVANREYHRPRMRERQRAGKLNG